MAEKRALSPQKGFYFEEFEVGQSITSPGRTVTEADVVAFAGLTGDWTPLHTDAVYAAGQLFGQRVAHGLLALAVASGLAMRLGFLNDTLLAFREISGWKFSLPVLLGDTLHMRAVVAETKPVRRLGGGLVSFAVEVINQEEKVVQHGAWVVLVKGQPGGA
jgi:acyl dehydratase